MTGERTSRRLGRGRGVLLLISALLASSALVRAAAGYDGLAASEPSPPDAGVAAEPAVATDASLVPGEGGMSSCPTDDVIAGLVEEIGARKRQADSREADLARREALVASAEMEIRRKLEELKAAEERLAETIARAETAAEDDLSRLTAVYENMKPKEAAELFGQMAPDFAAGFLARMRPDAAAAIMAGLKPRAAYAISVVLAGRNAGAPRE